MGNDVGVMGAELLNVENGGITKLGSETLELAADVIAELWLIFETAVRDEGNSGRRLLAGLLPGLSSRTRLSPPRRSGSGRRPIDEIAFEDI